MLARRRQVLGCVQCRCAPRAAAAPVCLRAVPHLALKPALARASRARERRSTRPGSHCCAGCMRGNSFAELAAAGSLAPPLLCSSVTFAPVTTRFSQCDHTLITGSTRHRCRRRLQKRSRRCGAAYGSSGRCSNYSLPQRAKADPRRACCRNRATAVPKQPGKHEFAQALGPMLRPGGGRSKVLECNGKLLCARSTTCSWRGAKHCILPLTVSSHKLATVSPICLPRNLGH